MALAAWLAGASALMGCAYAMAGADPVATEKSHHAMPAAPMEGKPSGHECCSKPTGSEEPGQRPEQGQFQECCFRVTPATVGKGKPAKVQLAAVSERVAAGAKLAISREFHEGIEKEEEDSRGDYLLFGVLRI